MNYDTIANPEIVTKTIDALNARNFHASEVASKEEALETIKKLIPAGASVMNGASRTLEEIGFIDYLKAGEHGWENVHEQIIAETDPVKKSALRKQGILADFYLGSVHAVSETGELVIASASGSQLPHLAFTSQNLILAVGTQKIAPTLDAALTRLREYVVPLENERMISTGAKGTTLAKILILEQEPAFMNRNVHVLFVNEPLGF
jgi:hypothetical protein